MFEPGDVLACAVDLVELPGDIMRWISGGERRTQLSEEKALAPQLDEQRFNLLGRNIPAGAEKSDERVETDQRTRRAQCAYDDGRSADGYRRQTFSPFDESARFADISAAAAHDGSRIRP